MDINALWERALGQAADAVLITDADLNRPGPRILYANTAFCQMTGYSEPELRGNSPRLLQGAGTDPRVLDELRRCLAAGQAFCGSTINYAKSGQSFYMEWHASPVFDVDGTVTHFLSIHRDVTAHKRFERDIQHYVGRLLDQNLGLEAKLRELEDANARLLTLATTDGLTGLANHRHFHETLAKMLNEGGVSLLLLDVDHFKPYNDAFGHPAGDAVLQTLASVLETSANRQDLVARYGGEEFALLLPGRSQDEAVQIAEQVRASIEAASWPLRPITVSIGVASVAARGSAHQLVENADRTLYAAKAQGRNRVREFRAFQPLPSVQPSAPLSTPQPVKSPPQGASVVTACDPARPCAPSPEGCRRCQAVGPSRFNDSTRCALVLGVPDRNAETTLTKALAVGGFAAQRLGPVWVLPYVHRLDHVGNQLKELLAPHMLSQIRAAVAPGKVDTAQQALAAMARAEPLQTLVEQIGHEWLRDALTYGWLMSYFHPIIHAFSGTTLAQEALLRARNPRDGSIIGAGQILEAAQALNLMHQLDQAARRVAIRGAAEHLHPSAKVFINFMPNTIYDPEVCLRTTMEAAAQYDVPLNRLVFEVVETEQIPDMGRLQHILDYYRAKGVGTAVDDMGAGFTSVRYLTDLRPDYVKLDRDLITRIEHEPSARERMSIIVGKARELGIRIIAEGIENERQVTLCQEQGVDFLQGFLFARPACPPQKMEYQVPGQK